MAVSTLDEHRVISVRAIVPVFGELAQPSDPACRSCGALPESPTPLAVHCSQPSDRTGRLSVNDTTAAATHVCIDSELYDPSAASLSSNNHPRHSEVRPSARPLRMSTRTDPHLTIEHAT